MSMKIYCAHPMSGLSFGEVAKYYRNTIDLLSSFDYTVLCPMTKKEMDFDDALQIIKPHGGLSPTLNDKAIFGRDHWMVHQADVVYINFTGTTRISIGCVMELAFARAYKKHTIIVMESDNIHRHSFVLQCSDIIFEYDDEAKEYLEDLIKNGKANAVV